MRYLLETLAWLGQGAHWRGSTGIGLLVAQHLGYSLLALALASLAAVPLGWWMGATGRGRALVVALGGAARALPTLGVVTLTALWLGIGLAGPLVALVVLAFPSVLAGACTGVEAAPHEAVDGARACGMTPLQVLARVQVPLGVPQLLGGLRSASLQVIATATLAAYTGAGGLGRLMFLGLKTQDYPMMLASALLVVVLALASETFFALVQRAVRPPGRRDSKEKV